jgi:hypothetical protein
MRFPFLRPMHGWRAFAGEVGIIVVGVLIALAAQQAVETWRWQQDVERTREDLDDEILYNIAHGAERIAVDRCLRERLRYVGEAVAGSNGRWTPLPPVGSSLLKPILPLVYRAPNRVFTTDVWEQAKANGVVSHMAPLDVQTYSSVYGQIADLREHNAEEQRLMPALSFLGFAGRLDPSSRERGLTILASLDMHNGWMSVVAQQIADVAARSKRRMSDAAIKDARDTFALQRKLRGACVDDAAGWKMLAPLMSK